MRFESVPKKVMFLEDNSANFDAAIAMAAQSCGAQRIVVFIDANLGRPSSLEDSKALKFEVVSVDTEAEPTVDQVNSILERISGRLSDHVLFVGIGGGSVLDICKAVSNLWTNPGLAEDYQGWDLLKCPSAPKLGIPTLFGTGAEATRTCVLLNLRKNIKLGMNSEFSVFDYIIYDPSLSLTAPLEQVFFTAMDAYIHSFESKCGIHRNPLGDRYSEWCLDLIRGSIGGGRDLRDLVVMRDIALASYFGGLAIGMTYVGLIHPLSAALSTVFHTRHCYSNCLVMKAMAPFYPAYFDEFEALREACGIRVPKIKTPEQNEDVYARLYAATVVHQKPLMNFFGQEHIAKFNRDFSDRIFSQLLES